MHEILFAFWFFIPAGLANAVPPLAAHVPLLRRLNAPLDAGKSFRGQRIFGPNKTWRGLIIGIIVATIIISMEKLAYDHAGWVRNFVLYDYGNAQILALGPLLGFGALAGDAVESFIKRQLDKQPGSTWFPFDQIDYIIGGVIASTPILQLQYREYLLIAVIWFGMHMLGSTIGYFLGVKDRPI